MIYFHCIWSLTKKKNESRSLDSTALIYSMWSSRSSSFAAAAVKSVLLLFNDTKPAGKKVSRKKWTLCNQYSSRSFCAIEKVYTCFSPQIVTGEAIKKNWESSCFPSWQKLIGQETDYWATSILDSTRNMFFKKHDFNIISVSCFSILVAVSYFSKK